MQFNSVQKLNFNEKKKLTDSIEIEREKSSLVK